MADLAEEKIQKAEVVNLPISLIFPNPNQPRKLFDNGGLKAMAMSFNNRRNVVNPIIVTPRGKKYMIVDGERRYRSAKEMNLTHIFCIIHEKMGDHDVFCESTLANFCREDMTNMEKARAINRMMIVNSWNQKEVSERVGLSPGQISNLLNYLNLSVPLQELLLKGEMSEGAARLIASFEKGKQQMLLKRLNSEAEKTGKNFSPQEMLRFLRKTAAELEINHNNKRPKRRNPDSHETMVIKHAIRSVGNMKKALEELSSISLKELQNLDGIHHLNLECAIESLIKASLKQLERLKKLV